MNARSRPWLTLAEAAERAHRSKRTIQRWGKEGRVRTWAPLGIKLYSRDDIDKAKNDTAGQGVR